MQYIILIEQSFQQTILAQGMLPELTDTERQDDLFENAIFIQGENDGQFDNGDFILFYGEGADKHYYNSTTNSFRKPNNVYSEKNYYFIKIGSGNGKRIQSQSSVVVTSYVCILNIILCYIIRYLYDNTGVLFRLYTVALSLTCVLVVYVGILFVSMLYLLL